MTPGNEAPVTDAFILGDCVWRGEKGKENYGGEKRGGFLKLVKRYCKWGGYRL
jgi:hypothetical protein